MRPLLLAIAAAFLANQPVGAGWIQDRIDAAEPGATVEVPPGVYRERLVVSKPVTLVGRDGAVVDGGGKGKVIHIVADDVVVRGFQIRSSGLELIKDDAAVFVTGNRATIERNVIEDSLHGVYLKKSKGSQVISNRIIGKTLLDTEGGTIESGMGVSPENCDVTTLVSSRRGNGIHLWNSEGTVIRDNEISEVRDGIYFSFANRTHCEGNRIRRARYGLHYMYSDDNVFTGNTFADNDAGAALMFSKRLEIRKNRFTSNQGFRAYGIILQSMDDCRLEANVIESNAVGISFNQCNRNRVIGNRVARNYIGIRFGSNSDENGFSLNAFTQNVHPVEISGETGSNQWALAGVGNFWDGAASFDLNRDAILDLPHRELDMLGPLRRDFPAVALLSESPALKLLRFAHQRTALPGAGSVEDPRPLDWRFPALRVIGAAAP